MLHMESEDDWDSEILGEDGMHSNIEVKDRGYGKPTKITEVYPIEMEDSAKFGSQL